MTLSARLALGVAVLVALPGLSTRAYAQADAAASPAPVTDEWDSPSAAPPAASAEPASDATPTSDASAEPASATAPTATADPNAADATAATAEPDAAAPEAEEPAAPIQTEPPPVPLTAEQQRILVAAPGDVTDREASGSHRFLLPPYLEEWGRGHHTRVFFPLYFETNVRDDHRLVIPPYYRVRTPTETGDVVFPLVFHFRGHEPAFTYATDIVGPVWYATTRGPGRAHSMWAGVAPIFSYREDFGENGRLQREHLVIPALLTYHQWWPYGQTTVVGPVVYFRLRNEVNWAVVPFVFRHITPQRSWTLIPPLLTYRSHSYEDNTNFTVVGPFFAETGPDLWSYNLAPIFFSRHERHHARYTALPFFHIETGDERFTLITPVGGYSRDHDESTLILPIYQNHRGLTNIDAVAPFFMYSRTPRLGRRSFALLPIGFLSTSRTGYSWGLFPFVARFHEYGRTDTIATPLFVHSHDRSDNSSVTWVFPTIHRESHPQTESRIFNIYPLYFSASGRRWHHNVLFPFYYDITDEETDSQINVVFPFFARVRSHHQVYEWVFPNHVYWENTVNGERSFGWDFFPFVQYGEPHRGDVRWSILEGLVGYRRDGSHKQIQIFWVPIDRTPAANSSSPPPHARGAARGADTTVDL